jgi:hypothetical protein
MKLFSFSITVSGLMFAALYGIAQAAPITALPLARDASAPNITPVYYYHHYRHHHYWHHGGYPIAGFWNYYRTDWPGRGTSVESTR